MRGRLDLWLLPQPQPQGRAAPLARHELDEAERRRADSFRRPADRDLYVAAHVALRRLLGAHLRVPPGQVAFARANCPRCGGPHGRPVLAGLHPATHFSLSHSHGLALIGVAGAPVGVDVQRLPAPAGVELCEPALHPYERAELHARPGEQRAAFFARLWARKEAYLKGVGSGIGPWTSETYLGDGGPGAPRPPGNWSLLDVPCGEGHAAAAAIRGARPSSVAVRRLPDWAAEVGRSSTDDAAPSDDLGPRDDRAILDDEPDGSA
ncbi:4'-phosphopantetheinyl transferase family protein [Kitasatospora sp. NPDC008050]|uniref:4'-phosphopantetheinyl transferase family protein n=1 Tax=Kitasatospora sp. NPDC008050 TaxID=3364021 RepID=UPI0036E3709C